MNLLQNADQKTFGTSFRCHALDTRWLNEMNGCLKFRGEPLECASGVHLRTTNVAARSNPSGLSSLWKSFLHGWGALRTLVEAVPKQCELCILSLTAMLKNLLLLCGRYVKVPFTSSTLKYERCVLTYIHITELKVLPPMSKYEFLLPRPEFSLDGRLRKATSVGSRCITEVSRCSLLSLRHMNVGCLTGLHLKKHGYNRSPETKGTQLDPDPDHGLTDAADKTYEDTTHEDKTH